MWLASLVVLLLLVPPAPVSATDTPTWTWTTLPVGHGDAHVLIDPEDRAAVVDAGSTDTANVLVDYLRCRGVDRVRTLVLTHPHWDHIGGGLRLLRTMSIERVWQPGLEHSTPLRDRLRSALERDSVPRIQLRRGDTGVLLPGVTATVLNPGHDSATTLNQRSLALRFTIRGVRFLAMADVVGRTETKLVEEGLVQGAEVLKVAHHGDAAGTSEPFLESVRPQLALIPAPLRENDPWGYPHRELIARLNRHGVRWFQTGRHGYLRVVIPAAGPPNRYRLRTMVQPPCE